jgi:exodeoxyribonuclease VII large subunit
MSDLSSSSAGGNLPEFTVSELSQAVKRTIEGTFERVRVRGEVSGFKRAASGHLYLALKDEDAVLEAVCWRGMAGRLALQPEDGMEVIAVGRLTTYPGRSKYQIVIEQLELAGEGALLKLLEERRRKLAAEGLFDEDRKRPLPFLPEVIGIVTSPTGAVIRDILHRLADRFPRPVLVWPVLVQGENAAEQIAAAIAGFNALSPGGPVPRPDLLIVARGGGSLEDLWAFNEEIVVRAAAASDIPLISAVGHETDTTLIDFAADHRAPTPTAAAERAVPVRGELLTAALELGRRLAVGAGRMVEDRRSLVAGLARGLPEPRRLLEDKVQRLDDRADLLKSALRHWIETRRSDLGRSAAALPHPRQELELSRERLGAQGGRLIGVRPTGWVRSGLWRGFSTACPTARCCRAAMRWFAGRTASSHAPPPWLPGSPWTSSSPTATWRRNRAARPRVALINHERPGPNANPRVGTIRRARCCDALDCPWGRAVGSSVAGPVPGRVREAGRTLDPRRPGDRHHRAGYRGPT